MNVACLEGALAFKYPSQGKKIAQIVYINCPFCTVTFLNLSKYKCFFSVLPQKYAKTFILFYFIYCSLQVTNKEKDHQNYQKIIDKDPFASERLEVYYLYKHMIVAKSNSTANKAFAFQLAFLDSISVSLWFPKPHQD